MKELTTQAVQQAKRGDRFIIESIEEKDFFNKANAVKAEAKKMGISLGVVYHAPIKTGMIFVK
jgi:predicted transcriptional regulator YheO